MASASISSAAASAEEAEVDRLMSEGQLFLALDAAKTALEHSPSSLKLQRNLARALLKLGAAEEARKILEPLCVPRNLNDPLFLSLYYQFRQAAGGLLTTPLPENGKLQQVPPPEALMNFAELVGVASRAADSVASAHAVDEETLGLLGSTHKELFKESGKLQDARRSRDVYHRAFKSTRGYWTCINAATMSFAVGRMEAAAHPDVAKREQALALELAAAAAEICRRELAEATGANRFWLLATLGEALLHLGDEPQAIQAYAQAAAIKGIDDAKRISACNQLRLLRQWGLHVPQTILDSLRLPQVALFVGHMIDVPGRNPPRFPPSLEAYVRHEIDRHLSELDIRIAYGSAACGADLMFIEALQDREAEVNVVLPFDTEDFVKTSISFAGDDWVRRFRRAMKLAGKRVTFATAERYFGTVGLLAYANQIIHGLAYLRARSMGAEPYLLAVYDGSNLALGGGTADVIQRWTDKDRLRIVELPAPTTTTTVTVPAEIPPPPPAPKIQHNVPSEAKRVVRAMLFADVVGFSTLPEEQVPYFMYEFLNEIAKHLKQLPQQPRVVNTWGDAIFAVMDHALPMVEYARTLQRVVCATDWRKLGMPAEMSVRIGLHIGPVFEGLDAITKKINCFGSHVNRAARLELVTVPGYIYASQQFVALLTSEQRVTPEPPGGWPFTCEYLGTLNLAKNFGVLPTYYIRGRHGG